MIEIQFQQLAHDPYNTIPIFDINSQYKVDIKRAMQISIVDEYKKRPIKRGKPNERGARPNSRKFIDSSFLPNINEKGEFQPLNTEGSFCVGWLGEEFYKSIGEKPYTIETVI